MLPTTPPASAIRTTNVVPRPQGKGLLRVFFAEMRGEEERERERQITRAEREREKKR